MVKSYCLRQRKQTECVPGSEKIIRAKNGRLMMECVCEECGLVKARFVTAAFADRITNPGEYKNLPKKLVMPNIFEGSNRDYFVNRAAREVINKIQTQKMDDEMGAEERRRKNARARARRQQTSILNFNPKDPKSVKAALRKRLPKGIDSNQTKADKKIFETILNMEQAEQRAERERGRKIAKRVMPVPSRLGEDSIKGVMDDFNLNVPRIIDRMQAKKYENVINKMEAKRAKKKCQTLARKYEALLKEISQAGCDELIRDQGN